MSNNNITALSLQARDKSPPCSRNRVHQWRSGRFREEKILISLSVIEMWFLEMISTKV